MTENSRRKRLGTKSWIEVGEHITDQDELDRLAAQRAPDDGGASLVVGEACSVLARRERDGKPASAVPMILGLAEILTTEQQLDLSIRLPALLSAEARAKLAEAARPLLVEANGTH